MAPRSPTPGGPKHSPPSPGKERQKGPPSPATGAQRAAGSDAHGKHHLALQKAPNLLHSRQPSQPLPRPLAAQFGGWGGRGRGIGASRALQPHAGRPHSLWRGLEAPRVSFWPLTPALPRGAASKGRPGGGPQCPGSGGPDQGTRVRVSWVRGPAGGGDPRRGLGPPPANT